MPAALRVLVLYGTRPEAIKVAPVAAALERRSERVELTLCSTGQHGEMVRQVEELFDLVPTQKLEVMRPSQSLNGLASRMFASLDEVFDRYRPDWILVQGDTTSAMVGALAGFHRGVKVGHIEAGLRSGDMQHPFPEEANRRLIDTLSDALFAPTVRSAELLAAEGFAAERIFLTGNTVVDALESVSTTLRAEASAVESGGARGSEAAQPLVLVTLHRRESHGQIMETTLKVVAELAEQYKAARFCFPVHRNPAVVEPSHRILGGIANVELLEPLDYRSMVAMLMQSTLVITDSGGLQEEAPTFGVPVLVVRETTERPEGVDSGIAQLVGRKPEALRRAAGSALDSAIQDPEGWRARTRTSNPYGDGRAGERIASILLGDEWTPWPPSD